MRRGYLEFLFAVSLVLLCVNTDADAAGHNLQGIVGGSVRIRCGLDPFSGFNGLYFQKKSSEGQEIFINGYYDRPLTVLPEYINRTFFNKTDLSMEMTNLTLSDEGDYLCIFICNGANCKETKFYLTVTANYSVPVLEVQGCRSGPGAHNCAISCSSSGGHPPSSVTWGVIGNKTSSPITDKEESVIIQDVNSSLWNVSQTVRLNCSHPLNITCSVGGVVSHAVSVCQDPDTQDKHVVVVCAVAVLLLILTIIIIFVIMSRRIQIPETPPSTDVELQNLNSRQAG
ncbi:T-lymphocyte activation antigen CD80-like isoform X2 [Clarias gariepinus]|uniref:T-lymphocyte activation antigen CD80-like isoform X2 n=1 Tax=Clarias gariepinus TaxID=13013 RepID=UPI00234DF35B|nr:T-lymphocyte activation antigen CD80-like isoform X2 [Clarias gariepinus]